MLKLATLVLVLGLATACSDTATSPATTTTDTLSGTVQPSSQSVLTFTAAESGSVTVTATALTPQATVGLAVGTLNGTSCTALSQASVQQGGSITASLSSSGTYCTMVYDAGSLTAAVAYTVTVVHP